MDLKSLARKPAGTQYYFFSGKGGVGKTSVAAATALKFARSGKKTLVISVDPAHSLSDSFDMGIGPDIVEIEPNLCGVEIDPAKSVEEYRKKLVPQLEKMDFLKGIGMEGAFDAAGMVPGIDELAAFDKFLQYMNKDEYDVIIFDTAPTGHALRFLSLPDVLDSWIGKMIKIRMQLSGVVNVFKKLLPFGEASEETGVEQLEAMKERISEAKKMLSDPARTHYNIVLIPEAMSILESERSLKVLSEYRIAVDTIIVNQLIPENPGCRFCQDKRKQQQERMEMIRQKFSSFNIQQLQLFPQEVRGKEMLLQVGKGISQKPL